MRRYVLPALVFCLILTLSACKEEQPEPQPDGPITPVTQDPVEPEQLPVIQDSSEEPVIVPQPITQDETARDIVSTITSDVTQMMLADPVPEIAPGDEESIVALRDWMQAQNDKETYLQFDTANLGMTDYGYCLHLYSPVDYWGSPMCFYIQDTPSGHQVVAVSAGQDGDFTYQGYGPDYSSTGFGDDDVRRLEI